MTDKTKSTMSELITMINDRQNDIISKFKKRFESNNLVFNPSYEDICDLKNEIESDGTINMCREYLICLINICKTEIFIPIQKEEPGQGGRVKK